MPSLYGHKCVPVLVCMFQYCCCCCSSYGIGMCCVLNCRNEIHMWPHTIIIYFLYWLSFGFLFRLCLLFLLLSYECICFFFTSNSFQRFSCRRRRQKYYCHISNRLLFFSLIPYFKPFKPIHRTFESRSECTV